MSIFKRKNVYESLLNIQSNPNLQNDLIALQNEINSYNDTSVVSIASLADDKLSACFAKSIADSFAVNGLKTLIIDANMYNPSLLPNLTIEENQEKKKDFAISQDLGCFKKINDLISVLSLNKQIYPGDIFKNGTVKEWAEKGKKEFDHVLIILPSVREHKEVILLNGVITSIILVTRRNIDATKDIFDFNEFCKNNELPSIKTILIK